MMKEFNGTGTGVSAHHLPSIERQRGNRYAVKEKLKSSENKHTALDTNRP